MTPGADAERLAAWLDANRQQLIDSGATAKVVAIRSPTETGREEAEACAQKALDHQREGDLERAEALARHALSLHPSCLRAHALLGILKLESNQPETALEQFRQALVLSGDPQDRNGITGITDVLAGLGRTLMSLGCLEEAFEVFDRLRRTQTEHAAVARAALGHIAFLKDEVETSATWFAQCDPIHQYNVYLGRSLQGEAFTGAIGLCRGLLANPFVPSVLLGVERRFEELVSNQQLQIWNAEARQYVDDWGELWLRWPGMVDRLREDWDSPAIRKFMMRTTPILLKTPTSPRLAVWIHRTATELVAEDASRDSTTGPRLGNVTVLLNSDTDTDGSHP
jgi:tetratricopeptide (TPR) repeat protein